MPPIDTEDQPFPTCPYCGDRVEESESVCQFVSYWGDGENDGNYQCPECEQTYFVTESVTRTFTTTPIVQERKKGATP